MDNSALLGGFFSIITVTYNDKINLEKTILSVKAQKGKNIEFIVIDGGSTDGTVEIIRKYQDHIAYWISEPDKGIYDAMNKGWEQAHEDSYILFLGAGDTLIELPRKESFKNSDIIAGSVQIGDKHLYLPKTGIRLKLGNTLHHQALLVKKSLHIEPPFDLAYKTYADFDFNQRLIKAGNKICIDPKFKSHALEGGVSAKFDKQQSLNIVEKNFGWFFKGLAVLYYYLRHEV